MKKIFLISLLISSTVFAKTSFLDSVKRMKWKDIDVVWVEDDKFPQFTASFYFAEGALRDSYPGLTQATFDQLTSGTTKETQRQIAEFFDFYGANLKHSVTHEYSVFTVQGLTKDIVPVMGKVCELFTDAQYPDKELKSYVSRAKSQLNNLVTSHSGLADRVFRQISLEGTPYYLPTEGTIKSLDNLNPGVLKTRLANLNRTKKTLYIAGPKDILQFKDVLAKNCLWKNELVGEEVKLVRSLSQSFIYLVPVPGANQAQIRIGRYLVPEEMNGKYDQYSFLASFLGGGFTSKLVQELRVKRGLTYSAGAYVSALKNYGRAGVMTFSRNETATDAISLVRDIFSEISDGKISEKEFKHQQGHQIGGFAFGFEETSAFLGQLMLYDHLGRSLDQLANFPEKVAQFKTTDLSDANLVVFPWDKMVVVVVGDPSLEKSLSRIRPVKILNYKDFL
ncbi:MAG: M16 family metallopeptidase [Bacteriovoracaceae bacterium]